jgi:hypothetical protein
MSSTQTKVRKPVDGDMEIELLRRRYHVLSGYLQVAKEERDEISEKLRIRAEEIGADTLTVGGQNVVSVCHFDRLSVKAGEIRDRYPRIFKRFGSVTPVTRVDVR